VFEQPWRINAVRKRSVHESTGGPRRVLYEAIFSIACQTDILWLWAKTCQKLFPASHQTL